MMGFFFLVWFCFVIGENIDLKLREKTYCKHNAVYPLCEVLGLVWEVLRGGENNTAIG